MLEGQLARTREFEAATGQIVPWLIHRNGRPIDLRLIAHLAPIGAFTVVWGALVVWRACLTVLRRIRSRMGERRSNLVPP